MSMQLQQTFEASPHQKYRSIQRLAVQRHSSTSALEIHTRALEVSTRYRRAEAELLEVLDQVDRKRVFLEFGASSLYGYCVSVLKLSESVTYNLIAVMRKSREVPELREQSKAGTITLSNARRVAAVLTPQNKNEWLERASLMSARQLEKEISKILPRAATREHATYVTPHRIKLELGLSETEMLKFRRIQDQVSQSRQKSATLEETLMELMNFYLARKCPIEKAKRHAVKKGLTLGLICNDGQSDEPAGNKRAPGAPEAIEAHQAPEVAAHAHKADRPAALTANASTSTSTSTSVPTDPPARASEMKRDTQVLRPHGDAAPRPKNARTPIPAKILHAVHLRDQRKCQYRVKNADEKSAQNPKRSTASSGICGQTRFLEVHHLRPVSEGGAHTLENLITLCGIHHDWIHSATARRP
jgi:5-methylcytosine-specific restriction endonuclease McrA